MPLCAEVCRERVGRTLAPAAAALPDERTVCVPLVREGLRRGIEPLPMARLHGVAVGRPLVRALVAVAEAPCGAPLTVVDREFAPHGRRLERHRPLRVLVGDEILARVAARHAHWRWGVIVAPTMSGRLPSGAAPCPDARRRWATPRRPAPSVADRACSRVTSCLAHSIRSIASAPPTEVRTEREDQDDDRPDGQRGDPVTRECGWRRREGEERCGRRRTAARPIRGPRRARAHRTPTIRNAPSTSRCTPLT